MIVNVDVGDGVGTITLNRPESRNALSGEVTELLDQAIVDLDTRDDVGAIILDRRRPSVLRRVRPAGPVTELRSVQQQRPGSPLKHLGLMPEHDTPVIGAINGAAVTGGLELAMSCDFLIASDRARFADTHARVGAMPGGGLTIRLPQLVGIDRARRMSFTGDFIDAQTGLPMGIGGRGRPPRGPAGPGPGDRRHHRLDPGGEHARSSTDVRRDRRHDRQGGVAGPDPPLP